MAATRDRMTPESRADAADVLRAGLLDMVLTLTERRGETWMLSGPDSCRHVGEAVRHFDAELDKAVTAIGNAVGALALVSMLHRNAAADRESRELDRLLDATNRDAAAAFDAGDAVKAATGYGTEFPPAVPDNVCPECKQFPCIGHEAKSVEEPVEDDDGPKTVLVENLPRVELVETTPEPKTRERALADLDAAAKANAAPVLSELPPTGAPGCADCEKSPSGVCNNHMPF